MKLFFVTLLLALPLGLPLALGEMTHFLPIRWLTRFYVLIFRGTPLMLQLFFFYFFFPIVLDIQITSWGAAVLTYVLNYAAYFAEIYRGGITSVNRGQYEAAYSLGLSKFRTTVGVVFPQAIRVSLPSLSNEAINLIKDTSLAFAISLAEIMKISKDIVNRDYSLVAYAIAALIYLVLTIVLTYVLHRIEKYASRYAREEERS